MHRVLPLFIAAVLAVLLVMPSGAQPRVPAEVDAWLKQANLGPYAPSKEDWRAVYLAARREGKVTVYTSSSRVPPLKKDFETMFPGGEFEAF